MDYPVDCSVDGEPSLTFQLGERKQRLNAFLKWLAEQKGISNLDCQEWLFSNYGMSDKAILETMTQLKRFQYILVRGLYLVINPKKKQLL